MHLFQVLAQVGPDIKQNTPPGNGLFDLPGNDLAHRDRGIVGITHALEPPMTTSERASSGLAG